MKTENKQKNSAQRVRQALKDKSIRRKVIQEILKNQRLKKKIVHDLANQLGEKVQAEPKFMGRILIAALSRNEFKNQIKGELWSKKH